MNMSRVLGAIPYWMLIFFIIGIEVAYCEGDAKSSWSADGTRGVGDGCLQMKQSPAFCDCYTNEVTSRIPMEQYLKHEASIDPIIIHCSKSHPIRY
jgi:hypothetical protein